MILIDELGLTQVVSIYYYLNIKKNNIIQYIILSIFKKYITLCWVLKSCFFFSSKTCELVMFGYFFMLEKNYSDPRCSLVLTEVIYYSIFNIVIKSNLKINSGQNPIHISGKSTRINPKYIPASMPAGIFSRCPFHFLQLDNSKLFLNQCY
jgi:hypothetical protein